MQKYLKSKWDIVLAALIFIVMLLGVSYCGNAEAEEFKPGWFAALGLAAGKNNNIVCLGSELDFVSNIRAGYEFNQNFSIFYQHNSCVAEEDNEGSLDTIIFEWKFKAP